MPKWNWIVTSEDEGEISLHHNFIKLRHYNADMFFVINFNPKNRQCVKTRHINRDRLIKKKLKCMYAKAFKWNEQIG